MGRSLLMISLLLCLPGNLIGQRFLADDPLWQDRDDLDIPCPDVVELSPTFDAIENTLGDGGLGRGPSANVNTLGEVPDSSWFENRLGRGTMTPAELVAGGDQRGGPDFEGPIRVVGAGLGTLTDSLVIQDQRGDLYFINFDPVAHPNLGTAADVITSRFLHAAGYRVLPTCLVRLDPTRLEVAPGARVQLLGGKEVPLSQEYLDSVIAEAARGSDGRLRVSAGRLPPGRIVGRFKFFGTRGDDANDIFRHENRRELRALQVFAAWLNHYNCNSLNTLDIWVTEGQRSFVRHFLVDFTSSLGSGYDLNHRVIPKDPRAGYEHSLSGNLGSTLRSILSLGLWYRPWLKIRYAELPEVGRIEGEFFDPGRWKPDYPNAAFRRLQPADALWAAGILARFSDEIIRAVVAAGEFSDPEAAPHLSEVLIQRRDKLLRQHLSNLLPLVDFKIEEGVLEFRNLGLEIEPAARTAYEYRWYAFDNLTGAEAPMGDDRFTGIPRIPIPQSAAGYLKIRLRSRSDDRPAWRQPVDVYLRRGDSLKIVGISRSEAERPEP